MNDAESEALSTDIATKIQNEMTYPGQVKITVIRETRSVAYEEVRMALGCGGRIVGVNNRNLKDFTVDPLNCLRLREYIPEDVIFVAESGIKSKEDIRKLYDNKVNAVLMGESLMRSPDKKTFIESLRELL